MRRTAELMPRFIDLGGVARARRCRAAFAEVRAAVPNSIATSSSPGGWSPPAPARAVA
jgi:hypothetical protein